MKQAKIDRGFSYRELLHDHDLYWSQSPKTWDDAAFLGNGMLGAAIYNAEHKSKRQTYRFVMGRMDVVAHRDPRISFLSAESFTMHPKRRSFVSHPS